MSISSVIKSLQDIMRKDAGVDGDAQRLGQLSWLLFLKIFDAQEEALELEQDNYQYPIPQRYLWRTWAANAEGITGDSLLEFVNDDLFPALKNLTAPIDKNPRGFVVRQAFSDAYNYMKNGTLLRQVINKLNEIDFTSASERHLFGDIYEQILKDLQSAGNAGEFYTPRAVTRFMVDRVDPKLGESIMDPACGTGGFLACAFDHVKKQLRAERGRSPDAATADPRRGEKTASAPAGDHQYVAARHRSAGANSSRQHPQQTAVIVG